MADKFKTLQNIFSMLSAEPPVFLRTAVEGFISIFLLALVIFFCILLLQISKNLVFKKGRHLFSQGLCCIALSLVLAFVFSPAPCTVAKEDGFKRVELVKLSGREKVSSRYFFIYEKQRLAEIMLNCTQTLSIVPNAKAKNGEENYMLNIIYNSGSEEAVYISRHGAYYTLAPKSSFVRRYVTGYDSLFGFLQNINIEGALT